MEVYGEEIFNGLACPPMDDFAFNFVSDDDAAMNLDADTFFDQIEEEEDVRDCVPIGLKRQQPSRKGNQEAQTEVADDDPIVNKKISIKPIKAGEAIILMTKGQEDVSDGVPIRLKRHQPPRKGKELKRVVQVLKPTQNQLNWIAECLKEDDQESQAEVNAAVDPDVNKKKMSIKPIKAAAEQKGKEEAINLMTKGQEECCDNKKRRPSRSCCGAKRKRGGQVEVAAADYDPIVNKKPIKAAAEQYCDKKKVLDESSIQLKFESTKRKLHDSYQRIEDAKKKKKIQLIEFQNPMPKAKAIRDSMKKNGFGGKKFHHPSVIPQY